MTTSGPDEALMAEKTAPKKSREKAQLEIKKAKLAKAIKQLRKDHPDCNLAFASDPSWGKWTFVPTPFPTLNALCAHPNGGAGFPRGGFTVIGGPQQTSKTTAMMQTVAHNHEIDENFVGLLTDVEHSTDHPWLDTLGVDRDRLILHQYDVDHFNTMERILDAGLAMVATGAIDMWIIDSVAALLPKAERDKALDEDTMLDLQRRLPVFFKKALNVIAPRKDSPGTACVLIGQVYSVPNTRGIDLSEIKGGNALKHYAHLRLITRRGRRDEGPTAVKIKMPDGESKLVVPGWAAHIRVDKTKINDKEGQEVVIPFMLGRGLDSTASAITALLANGVVERRGAWYYHDKLPDGKLQGRDSVLEYLKENDAARQDLIQEMDQSLAQRKLDELEPEAPESSKNEDQHC